MHLIFFNIFIQIHDVESFHLFDNFYVYLVVLVVHFYLVVVPPRPQQHNTSTGLTCDKYLLD